MITKTKPWGVDKQIFHSDYVSVHVSYVKPGGYSSEHLHKRKWNRLFIVSGSLTLIVGPKTISLVEGDNYNVPPNTRHQFQADEPCVFMEIYFLERLSDNDIVRFTVNGIKESVR